MKHLNYKGKYLLSEDFFPNQLRESLPVHLFLLRVETDNYITFDTRFYIKSYYHRNDRRIGGRFYKSISHII